MNYGALVSLLADFTEAMRELEFFAGRCDLRAELSRLKQIDAAADDPLFLRMTAPSHQDAKSRSTGPGRSILAYLVGGSVALRGSGHRTSATSPPRKRCRSPKSRRGTFYDKLMGW